MASIILNVFTYLINSSVHVCQVTSVMSDSLQPHGLEPARLLYPRDSPGKNTGVGCHALLQGIFPNPGIEPPSLMSPALAGGFFTSSTTQEALLQTKGSATQRQHGKAVWDGG